MISYYIKEDNSIQNDSCQRPRKVSRNIRKYLVSMKFQLLYSGMTLSGAQGTFSAATVSFVDMLLWELD